MTFSDEQLNRYSRQLVLPNIGSAGQTKLFNTSVLVVGAGGLGSAALLYLAGAGIGKIGIVDFDKVDSSNLHRQIIHTALDVGKLKTTSAKEKINRINPDIEVITFEERLEHSNIEQIFKDFEIIVDGLDNFEDKFLVNDYALKLNKKLVHGGVIGFEGQVLTIIPGKSACLRCVLPDIPHGFRQSCKDVGVLGTCVGVISTLQANEVIKLVLDIGRVLANRILKFNGLDGTFYELQISEKNNICNHQKQMIS